MHPCLQIAEVQHNIVAHLSARQDGYALMRTSRAFEEAGLNLIWKYVNGFEHLIRCMPTDVWREVPADGASGQRKPFVVRYYQQLHEDSSDVIITHRH